jgi:hypothetical protein
MKFLTPTEEVWLKMEHPWFYNYGKNQTMRQPYYSEGLGFVVVDIDVSICHFETNRIYQYGCGFGNVGFVRQDLHVDTALLKTYNGHREQPWVTVSTRSGGDWGIRFDTVEERKAFLVADYPFDGRTDLEWWCHS